MSNTTDSTKIPSFEVHKTFKGCISLRSTIVEQVIENNQFSHLKVTLRGSRGFMVLSREQLLAPISKSEPLDSVLHEGQKYYLYDYVWKPQYEEKDAKFLNKIGPSWYEVLADEFRKPYFDTLNAELGKRYMSGKCLPQADLIFRAYQETPFDSVKVVILGQDPYPNDNADGLAFSCARKCSPSLKNILTAMDIDIEFGKFLDFNFEEKCDLSYLAKQGVLLLNSVLTVDLNKPTSHYGIGWEKFTGATVKAISDMKNDVVFMLWGNRAKEYKVLIDEPRHLILENTHPASAEYNNTSWRCDHFSKANSYLKNAGKRQIEW